MATKTVCILSDASSVVVRTWTTARYDEPSSGVADQWTVMWIVANDGLARTGILDLYSNSGATETLHCTSKTAAPIGHLKVRFSFLLDESFEPWIFASHL